MKWYLPSEKKPEKSCEVVVLLGCEKYISSVMNTCYSKVHDAFNAHDTSAPEFVEKVSYKHILAWAYLSDFEDELLPMVKGEQL